MLATDLPAWALRAFAFVFGALWGSFFNVAIHRWPRDMSVVSPPSHCPSCQSPIPAWRNIPIVGYLLLRGRAACCGARLSPRYLLVELSGAVLCLALAERYVIQAEPGATLAATSLTTLLFFAFVGGLLIATFVDLEWMEIPDEVSIGGAALGLATVSLREPGPDAVDAALGAGGGFLLVQLLLVWSWERLTGRRGMGEGDSKLLMFIGAFLGWQGMLFALVAGAFQGLLIAGVVLASGRRLGPSSDTAPHPEALTEVDPEADADAHAEGQEDAALRVTDGTVAQKDGPDRLEVKDRHGRLLFEYVVLAEDDGLGRRKIPFGPFLALAALEFLFFGEPLIELYLGFFE